MFDKYRANTITGLYLETYAELKHLLEIKEHPEVIKDDELKVESLLNVYMEPTNRCNLNCAFCARENMNRDFAMLDMETFQRTIDSLPEGTYLTLTGNGEPTLNPCFYDMVSYASRRGMFVSVITNGCTLNETNRTKLMNSGISRVQISFQSLDKDTDERVMEGVRFERTLLQILQFIREVRLSGAPVYICISTVTIEDGREFAERTKEFWKRMPIDNYYEGTLLSLQTDSKGIKEFAMKSEDYRPCASPWITVKVNADGTVNPCPEDFSGKYSIGNIKEKTLGEILNSRKALGFRKASLLGDMKYLDEIGYCCKDCNTWSKEVSGSIQGVMKRRLPVRLGLVIHELSGDRSADIEFLEKAISFLESGETDLIHTLMEESPQIQQKDETLYPSVPKFHEIKKSVKKCRGGGVLKGPA